MKSIEVLPIIESNVFGVRINMSDYDVSTPLAFSIYARRSDGHNDNQRYVYPDPDIEYQGYVKVFFFDMAPHHFAQITDVYLNGQQVMNYYKNFDIPGEEIQARYNDSITSISSKQDLRDPKIAFSVSDNDRPWSFFVTDASTWGAIKDKKSIIEILLPGTDEPVVHFFGKNQVNVFTSFTLGLNCPTECVKDYAELPDGIYEITVKGSPSSYQATARYLRLVKKSIRLKELYLKAVDCDYRDAELKKKIDEIEFCKRVAESCVLLGNDQQASYFIKKMDELFDQANDCLSC